MKIHYFFGIALLITVLSCSADKEEGTNEPSLARIIVKKELVVGVDPSAPPLSFYSNTGAINGYESDIAQAISDKLGVKLRLVPIMTTAELITSQAVLLIMRQTPNAFY